MPRVIEVDYDGALRGAMPERSTESDFVRDLHTLLSEGEEEALQIFLRLARPEDIAEWLDVLSTSKHGHGAPRFKLSWARSSLLGDGQDHSECAAFADR